MSDEEYQCVFVREKVKVRSAVRELMLRFYKKKGGTDSEVEKEKVEVKEKRWRDGERGTRKDGAGRGGEREEEL